MRHKHAAEKIPNDFGFFVILMIKLILESECLMLWSGMAADKFKEMLDQEMSVLPKTISKHFTDTYYGMVGGI